MKYSGCTLRHIDCKTYTCTVCLPVINKNTYISKNFILSRVRLRTHPPTKERIKNRPITKLQDPPFISLLAVTYFCFFSVLEDNFDPCFPSTWLKWMLLIISLVYLWNRFNPPLKVICDFWSQPVYFHFIVLVAVFLRIV